MNNEIERKTKADFYKFLKEPIISPVENVIKLCHTIGYGGMVI